MEFRNRLFGMVHGRGRRFGRSWLLFSACLLAGLIVGVARASAPVATFNSYPDPNIHSPEGITAGPDGALWFTSENSIGRITTDGSITNYNGSGGHSIAAGPDGALWFTSDRAIGRITTDGAVTLYGDGCQCVSGAKAITAGPDGAMWFTQIPAPNWAIGRITTDGTVTIYHDPGIAESYSIVAGPDGALWFTNYWGGTGAGSIGRVTTDGVFSFYTDPSISNPLGIAVGPDGALWFTNYGNHSIGRITTDGTVSNYPGAGDPTYMAAGPDGALWFTDYNHNSIGRITTSGDVSSYSDPTIHGPTQITTGSDGALWFTNWGSGAIGRIQLEGASHQSASDQTITFSALTDKVFGDPPFTVSATASSNLPVTFASATPSVCTVSASTVTLVGVGTCTITADQAGDASYNPAPTVSQSFTVTPSDQTITFSALTDKVFGDPPFTVSATASSNLPVTFASATPSVCTVSASTVTLVGVGTCTITADQAGDASYNPAPTVSQSFTVGYVFSGFLGSVANPNTVNMGKAGRTYPVKWQLQDASGNFVSSLSAVSSIEVKSTSCTEFSSNSTDTLAAEATGGTVLRYDSSANQYVYNWETPKQPGCFTLFLNLVDGHSYPAFFQLN